MTVVNPKSISGITSITTASGSDNLLTIHTSDANNTERFRIDSTGTLKVGSGVTINQSGDTFNTGVTTVGSLSVSTGFLKIPDSIIHVGDSDTKIRFPDNNTITAETGGAERLRIESSGNIGIGTDNPNNMLHVYNGKIKAQTRYDDTSTNIDLIRAQSGSGGNALFAIRAVDAADNNSNWDIKTNALEDLSFTIGAGSEKIRIKENGKVGIGTTNPAALLHLTAPNSDCELILESDVDNDDEYDNSRILFRQDGGYDQSCVGMGGTTNDSQLHNCLTLRNSTASAGGILLMTNNVPASSGKANHLESVTRLKVTSTGNVEVNTGNVVIKTAGKGIDFSNQTATSVSGASATSELLDHYEEGNWTPVLSFGGGTTGISYNNRDGSYVRIGRQVTLNWTIQLGSKGSSTGAATVTGLPFDVDDLLSSTVLEASGISGYWTGFDPHMYMMCFTAETTNGAQITMRSQDESGGPSGTVSAMSDSDFSDSSSYRGSITYFTDT